jgi:hypothetical protein
MSELVIRETLVFGGAVAGALWGYFLGRLIERRQFALEVSASLEALERWAIQVGHGLESLERSLVRIGYFYVSDAPAWDLAEAKAMLSDTTVRVPTTSARR